MASKVVWYREAWWIRTRWGGNKKKDRRIGTTKADKRQAEQIAKQINAALAVGTFEADGKSKKPMPCDAELRRWHQIYGSTMQPTSEISARGLIENHLAPHFQARDLRDIREADLLEFAKAKVDSGLSPKTAYNALSVLRRVYYLAQRDGRIERNPAARIGELMRRLDRRHSHEVEEAEAWNREEIESLLNLAKEHEPRFYPALLVLFSTGLRRGELLGIKWADVDFERHEITIRRSITIRQVTTPKSGRRRVVGMAEDTAVALFDLFTRRRQETLRHGWREVPEWVFCSINGERWWDERHFSRVWERLRRRAQKEGVRPLKLHSTRHTWATFALAAGKSVRWVADQLGHADPALTLRVYAHAIQDEESDLSFANFGDSKRLYPAPTELAESVKSRNPLKSMVGRQGLEPWTIGLKARCSTN
jgi:integrase